MRAFDTSSLSRGLLVSSILLQQSTEAFQIGPLLSSCIDACQRGCDEIRTVQEARSAGSGTGTGTGDSSGKLQVEFKDAQDPRSALTVADEMAQMAIMGSLRSAWGDALHMVGEEEDSNETWEDIFRERNFAPLRQDMLIDDIGETSEIDPEDITIFIDPLDGTREFVEGRLENCMVLVGIAIRGEAVAGAIGMPFPAGDLSTAATVVYGLADLGTGVVGAPLVRGPIPLERNIEGVKYPRPHHATGENPVEVVKASVDAVVDIFGGSNVFYGGAGNKILAAALGETSSSIQHKVGGPWDLCAPQAIAKAMGAGMTDLFGEEIAIYQKNPPPRCNERGFVVSAPGLKHKDVITTIGYCPKVQEYRKSLEKETVDQN